MGKSAHTQAGQIERNSSRACSASLPVPGGGGGEKIGHSKLAAHNNRRTMVAAFWSPADWLASWLAGWLAG